MRWILYHAMGLPRASTPEGLLPDILVPECCVELHAPSGVVGRADVPSKFVHVSRTHLYYRIDERLRLFITDASLKGTSVNGKKLTSGSEVEVLNGVSVVLAGAESFWAIRLDT